MYVERLEALIKRKQDEEGLVSVRTWPYTSCKTKEELAKAILEMIEAPEVEDKTIY